MFEGAVTVASVLAFAVMIHRLERARRIVAMRNARLLATAMAQREADERSKQLLFN